MQMFMGGVVLGVNRERQAFNGAQMQRTYLLHMQLFCDHLQLFNLDTFLLILKPAKVETVRAVDHVHDRHDHERTLPTDETIEEADGAYEGSAGQIIGQGPEISLRPQAAQWAPLCQCDNDGYRQGV